MLNDLAITEREHFFDDHGAWVLEQGEYIFEDGAICEDSPLGRMMPPAEDEYEREQTILRYWEIVAEAATQNFEDFKSYLGGTGKRLDAWATLYTEEDQLTHLRHLQDQAKRVRAKLYRQRRKVKEAKPFWITQREEQEIADQTARQQFKDKLQEFTL